MGVVYVLVGCATTREPTINTLIQKVDVPIAVSCKVDMPVKPVYNFSKLGTDADIFDKIKALLADRKLSQGYELEMETALNSCVK